MSLKSLAHFILSSRPAGEAFPKKAALRVLLDLTDHRIDLEVLLAVDTLALPNTMEASAVVGDECSERTVLRLWTTS